MICDSSLSLSSPVLQRRKKKCIEFLSRFESINATRLAGNACIEYCAAAIDSHVHSFVHRAHLSRGTPAEGNLFWRLARARSLDQRGSGNREVTKAPPTRDPPVHASAHATASWATRPRKSRKSACVFLEALCYGARDIAQALLSVAPYACVQRAIKDRLSDYA